MLKGTLTLATALSLALGSAATAAGTAIKDTIDPAHFGTWTGSVTEQGVEVGYDLTLTIFDVYGRVFHNAHYGPPYNCRGGGVVMQNGGEALHMIEVIVDRRGVCADGTFRLYRSGENALIWEWFYPDGEYAARADLTRQK